MTDQYMRAVMKVVVAQIAQTIGWHAIQSTPLELMADVLHKYLQEFTRDIARHVELYNRTEANLDDVGLSVKNLNISIDDLLEYVTHVDPVPCALDVPKFPARKESNLNFLKPGSKEVLTRPVHIFEHMPPIYPEREVSEADALPPPVAEASSEVEATPEGGPTPAVAVPEVAEAFEAAPPPVNDDMFKKPDEQKLPPGYNGLLNPKRNRLSAFEEEGRPTREIASVMMTSSGFISPSVEGKLPDAKPPVLPDFSHHEKAHYQPTAAIPPPHHQSQKPAMPVSGLDNKFDKKSKKKHLANGLGGPPNGPVDMSTTPSHKTTKKKHKMMQQQLTPPQAPSKSPGFGGSPYKDVMSKSKAIKNMIAMTSAISPMKSLQPVAKTEPWEAPAAASGVAEVAPPLTVAPVETKPPKAAKHAEPELDRNKLNIFKKIPVAKKEREEPAPEGVFTLPSGTTITPTVSSPNKKVYAPPPEDDQVICVDDEGGSGDDGLDGGAAGAGDDDLQKQGKKQRKHKKHKKERKERKMKSKDGKRPVGRPSLDSLPVNTAPTQEEFAMLNKKLLKMDTVLKPAPADTPSESPPPPAEPENPPKRHADPPPPFGPHNFMNMSEMYPFGPTGFFPFRPGQPAASCPRELPPFVPKNMPNFPMPPGMGDMRNGVRGMTPFGTPPFLPFLPMADYTPRPGLIPGPGLFGQFPPYIPGPPMPKKVEPAPEAFRLPTPEPKQAEQKATPPKPHPTIFNETPIEVSDDSSSVKSDPATTKPSTPAPEPPALPPKQPSASPARESLKRRASEMDEDDDDEEDVADVSGERRSSPDKLEGKARKEHKRIKRDKEGKIKKKKEKSKNKEKSEKRRDKEEKKDKEKLKKLKKEKKKEKLRAEEQLSKYTGSGPSTSAALVPPGGAGSLTNPDLSVPKLTLKFGNTGCNSTTPEPAESGAAPTTAGVPRKPLKSTSSTYIDIDDDDDMDVARCPKRDVSPELARISPLVTRPPKQKSITEHTPPQSALAHKLAHAQLASSPVADWIAASDFRPQRPYRSNPSEHGPAIVAAPVPAPVLAPPPPSHEYSGYSNPSQSAPPPPAPPVESNRPSSYIDAEGNEVWICPACGRVDDGTPMIGCDGCDAWYHWVCVGIQIPPGECEDWFCRVCIAKKQEEAQGGDKKRKKKKSKKQASSN